MSKLSRRDRSAVGGRDLAGGLFETLFYLTRRGGREGISAGLRRSDADPARQFAWINRGRGPLSTIIEGAEQGRAAVFGSAAKKVFFARSHFDRLTVGADCRTRIARFYWPKSDARALWRDAPLETLAR